MPNELINEVRANKSFLAEIAAINGKNKKGKPEEKKKLLDPADRNMQLALTRLVNDDDEQELARKDGKAFQVKYDLSNDQMYTLCRLAIQIGFYKDTKDLEAYLNAYAKLPKNLRDFTPGNAGLHLNGGGPIGSCSCSCP